MIRRIRRFLASLVGTETPYRSRLDDMDLPRPSATPIYDAVAADRGISPTVWSDQ